MNIASGSLVAQRLMIVDAQRELSDRVYETRKRHFSRLAVVRELLALDDGIGAVSSEDLLLFVVSRLDRELSLTKNRQPRRIRFGRRCVISQAEKRPSHAQRARPRVAEVELKTRQRLDIGV